MPRFKSRTKIEEYQAIRMEKFAKKTLSKSAFYRPYFVKDKFNWTLVPLMSKTQFMQSFNQLNTLGIKLEEAMQIAITAEHSRDFKSEINGITVGLSTGTSGKRGVFLVSKNERAQWAALVLSRVLKPKFFKKQKVAFFLRANSNLYASITSGLFDFKYFDIFKPIAELLEELNRYKPNILASQPSVLMDIAQAQNQQKISIEPIQVISFAEVLHQNDKQIIESVFKIPITEVYQCTEGFLGVACRNGTMHLNEDFVHFDQEWVDEDKFYPIVTDFSRHSQSIVKYKMNDLLQIKNTECACGSKLLAIEKIIGRDDDVIILNNIKVYPDIIARKIAMHTDDFQKYAITQIGPNLLEIVIACEKTDWVNTKNIFQSVLQTLFDELSIANTEFRFHQNKVNLSGNKTRKIKRLVDEN